jgi:hypothetical protein
MANWKGDLRKLEKAEHIFNVTFDKASWTTPEGPGIRNASLSLDTSPLMMEGRQMQCEIGGSPIVMDLKLSGFPEKPEAVAKVSAGELKPLEVWAAATALFQSKAEKAAPDFSPRVKEFIQALLPEDKVLKNVRAEVRYNGVAWDVPVLQFESYGGKADLKGLWSLKDKEPGYRLEGEFRGVDLGLFLSRAAGQKVFEGVLDLKGSIEGTEWGPEAWGRSLKGQGEFTLTGGKFMTFDLKDVLSTIEPFRDIGRLAPSLKDFGSMNFKWKILEGKVTTDNLLVENKDYIMDGEGALGFDGLANYRMDVFLSSELAAKLLPEMAKPFKKNPQAHLGPIPTLLSGSLLAPEVKPDPAQVGELTEKIRKGNAKEILYELVTE